MKLIPYLALALAAFSSSVEGARAQNVVAVGKGSYASFPPPGTGDISRKTLDKQLYLLDTKEPIPTNDWWTNLLTSKYAGQLWAYPHQVKANADGIDVTFPTRWNDSGTDPVSEFPLGVRGRDFHPVDSRAKNWSDWLVSFRMAQSADKSFDVTLGRGLPYVWIEFNGVAPELKIPNNATYFDSSEKELLLPATSDSIGISFGDRNFAVFAPQGTKFSRAGEMLDVDFVGTKKMLAICPLPSRAAFATFAKYADAIPRDSKLSWNYDATKGTVSTKWHLETELWRGAKKKLIQGWLPHHWRDTTNDLKMANLEYISPRGKLKCATGTDFQITYPFHGFPPSLPAPAKTGLANDYDEARMRDYLARYQTKTERGDDTYWGGKKLTQMAQYMAIAKSMNDPSFEVLRTNLREALADWFTYTPDEKQRFFARYPKWGALVGYKTSYGSEDFNDHHFHYGYFTQSSAMLGFYDPQFLKDYGQMARLVAKEYANWERKDKDFPFMRTFDLWEGHSWAGGFSGGTGNNQESSSEAMQSWSGLFLLGTALNDKEMAAAGAMGYAMESRATMEYWFNVHGDNWPPSYKHQAVGMAWSGGNAYGTYFSGDPAWIWGIQWLPMSPALAYLVEDKAFAKKSFGEMYAARKAKEGDVDLNKIGPALGNVILGQAAQVNPDWTAQQMDELWAANSAVARDNDTPGLTYYLAHANRTLGDIQWDSYLSLPLSRVYFNARTKTRTYVVFNPTDTAQTAQVFQNGKAIGLVRVPPHTLVSTSKLDTK